VKYIWTSGITSDNEDTGEHTTYWHKNIKGKENLLSIDGRIWDNCCIVLFCTKFNSILEEISVNM
jgi:hypothetical protein